MYFSRRVESVRPACIWTQFDLWRAWNCLQQLKQKGSEHGGDLPRGFITGLPNQLEPVWNVAHRQRDEAQLELEAHKSRCRVTRMRTDRKKGNNFPPGHLHDTLNHVWLLVPGLKCLTFRSKQGSTSIFSVSGPSIDGWPGLLSCGGQVTELH